MRRSSIWCVTDYFLVGETEMILVSTWSNVPAAMLERGQVALNLPTGALSHKAWHPVQKQDQVAKRNALARLLSPDPTEQWVLVCLKHCKFINF